MHINDTTVSIVTGGSSGIGLAISKELAKMQSTVYLFARDKDKLERARREIQDLPQVAENKVLWRSVDITNTKEFLHEIDDVYDKEQRLDLLVNNAGFFVPTTVDGNRDDPGNVLIEEKLHKIHFLAPLIAARHVSANYRSSGLAIHNVASHAVLKYLPDNYGYGVAKASLVEAMRHLSTYHDKDGVSNVDISTVFPGVVGTKGVIELMKEGILSNPTSPESVAKTSIHLIQSDEKYAYVGYHEGIGIVRRHYAAEKFPAYADYERETVLDDEYDPKDLLNN